MDDQIAAADDSLDASDPARAREYYEDVHRIVRQAITEQERADLWKLAAEEWERHCPEVGDMYQARGEHGASSERHTLDDYILDYPVDEDQLELSVESLGNLLTAKEPQ